MPDRSIRLPLDPAAIVRRQYYGLPRRGWGRPGSRSSTRPVADLVVDALVGYSLSGDPRGRLAELIDWANTAPVDAPSAAGPIVRVA